MRELASYSPNLAVMINSPILVNPVRVDGCVQNNLHYIFRNYIFCQLVTSKKGMDREVISHMSTILMYEVFGRPSETETNIVANTFKIRNQKHPCIKGCMDLVCLCNLFHVLH